ncbi:MULTISPECIES: NAD-dependent succinate-semialdehyde dehydrogenase [Paraburkholderia]|uniref:NAD-dependent succinate-semialdehyde dehydrogenase n=1 Tax=Paraburkholderia podalyriae TaxID=1938811 RepID=A0ABR7PU79_9BURK|nr:NAD-dependent succinate-semialdehyde dehydrogenase [Paraburkholderia podalyriae]MBC8749830.1 NAD-dependent succinate-semialdehyde dehydrogenase [Paraburkholderia podalyriae]
MKELARNALASLSRADLVEHRSYVNGSWETGHAKMGVIDPATGDVIAQIDMLSGYTADAAVDAAQDAFEDWRELPPAARGAILRRWAALLRSNSEDLSVIITSEQGKPIKESRSEVEYAANFLDWFAAEGERTYGETIPSHLAASRLSVTWQAIGVTAAVTPWNFPIAMITRKAGAALAAGCTMIVKPAPETPLSALAIAKLADEAGMPAGVFQVINGDAVDLSMRLLEAPKVRSFSFTGSTEVGRILLRHSAETVKKVSMELGGHAPFIVFDDASLDAAINGCVGAKFATSGQDCLAANRIYVQRSIYAKFVERFSDAVKELKVGHGLDPSSDIGPMTRRSVSAKCRDQIGQAVSAGARVVLGGRYSSLGDQFVPPTILADVADDMDIANEETFGPVAAILPFDTEAEVLLRANNSEYGLAAYVYTSSLNRAMRMSDHLEYGMVAVNTPKFTGAPIPFGGWKQSGLGREGSRYGMADYMEQKYTCFGNLKD